jgi:hypothetical protein
MICLGQSVNLTANGANTYSWSTGEATNVINPTPTVTTNYMVVGSSGTCRDTAYYPVTVNPLPTITVNSSAPSICVGESVTLTASGGATYQWGSQTGASIVISPSITGQHTVIGTDINGCMNVGSVNVVVDVCAGITNSGAGLRLSVYPNPNTGLFVVESDGDVHLRMFDGTGRVIMERDLTNGKTEVSMDSQAKGLYFIEFTTGTSSRTIKVIKD